MRRVYAAVPSYPHIRAFVLAARRLIVINTAARPDAKIIHLDFLP